MIEKLIKLHRNSDQIDFEKIWSEGLFTFDSNVILDLYRLPKSARNDLMSVFENDQFNKRIWIGFQVALEFLNNRYDAISDQKNKFNTVRTLLEDSKEQYEELVTSLRSGLNNLKLKQRHSLINPDAFITPENVENGIKYINDFIEELERLEKEQSDVSDHDEIKDFVFKTFEGKIGKGFDKKELSSIYKEGEKRYEFQFPPGYKDKGKEGSYHFEDKEYIRKYGDLILWKEIIQKAKSENYKYIVLVTGDIKEDWWFEKRGKKLGPRKELINEIYTEATELDTFYMYDTSTFLQYARNELNLKIQDSSINEAKDLIDLSRQERIDDEEGLVSLAELLKFASSQFKNLKVGIGRSVKNIDPIKINSRAIFTALMEIYSNVLHHGRDNYVGIQAKEEKIMFC